MNSKRVSWELGSNCGSVHAIVVVRFSSSSFHMPSLIASSLMRGGFEYVSARSYKDKNGLARPTLDIGLRAFYGDARAVSLSLPRSFCGPITIRTGDDGIAFSPAFAERVVLPSKIPLAGVQTYFVGDRPEA